MYRLSPLLAALVLPPGLALSALGDDVTVGLGAGDAFVVEDGSSVERLRVEDSGGARVTGDLDVDGRTVVDSANTAPRSAVKQPSLWVNKPDGAGGAALIAENGGDLQGALVCLGNIDSSDGFSGDKCGHVITNKGGLTTPTFHTIDGGEHWSLTAEGVIQQTSASSERPGNWMLTVASDVAGPAIFTRSSAAGNSSLQWFAGTRSGADRPIVGVFDDDVAADSGSEGLVLWFCDPTDLNSPDTTFDWTASTNNLAAAAGAPFAGLAPGTKLAVVNVAGTHKSGDANFQELVSVQNGGADVTLSNVVFDAAGTQLSIFACSERIYRDTNGGIVIDANRFAADPCASKPEGFWFYNDLSDYYCFCDGVGNDIQMHSPPTSCF